MGKIRPVLVAMILVLLALLASGCVLPAPRLTSHQSRDVVFVPPTLVPTSLPTSAASLRPTEPADCVDRLTFISDITVPDGTVVAANASIDKRWEVENNGTCSWGSKYQLKLIAGPELGVKPEQALIPNRSGTRGTIRLVFTAPVEPGSYRSAWQAFNPAGQPFGDAVYIEIVVQ